MNFNNNIDKRSFEEVILFKKTLTDKNGNDYLLLELTNKEAIFVFPSKVKQNRWEELKEDQKYEFFVQEGNNSSNILIDFDVKDGGDIFG